SRPAVPGPQLVLFDADSAESKAIAADDCAIHEWAWSPGGDRIIYAGDPIPHTFQADFFLHDLASGATRRLTDDLASDPAAQPVWLDERRVLVHAMRAGASQLEILDTVTGRTEVVTRWEARHSGLSVDRAGRYAVQDRMSPTSFGEINVYDRESATDRVVVSPNAEVLANHPPAGWERFEIQRGEFTIESWLFKPPDFDPAKRYPVILDVHGGPNGNYGPGFLAHEQCFATNGFLVLVPNARGSTSYGRRFAQQVLGDWGGEDYRDLMASLDAVLQRPYADPARTGIFGISYGGYMTAWVISQTTRFAAAACGEPFFDLESSYGTSMNGYRGIETHAGGPPHLRREWYDAHSPSTFAHQTRTPTLIFQGEADETCPLGQSEQMFVALHKAGCEVEFARYPGGSHMFFVFGPPEHRVDFLTRTLGWFKEHLGEPEEADAR
ncbi:MAG: S9 family peptidase, partial [Chloroflexota bacterium]|nr:S9 family peptidase [Chloroflexota bacterium]